MQIHSHLTLLTILAGGHQDVWFGIVAAFRVESKMRNLATNHRIQSYQYHLNIDIVIIQRRCNGRGHLGENES